jgi:Domain of unknown function (DUF4388)
MPARSDGAIALIQTMLALRAEHRTGVLDVRGADVHTLIHFREGTPVFAEDAAISGALNPQLPQVERARNEQARAAILRALQRDGSWWSFDDSPERQRPESSFFLDLESIALDVMRHLPSDRKVTDLFSERMDERARVLGDPNELATRFTMTSHELAFLPKLDGSKTVRALLGGAHPIDVSALLGTLVLFGAVELTLSPAALAKEPVGAEQVFQRGMSAMAEGDEAAAKKYFYEALRLDPESPAKSQVRLLALRTTPPPPVVEEIIDEVEPEPEPAVESVPVPAPKAAPEAEAPKAEPEPEDAEIDHGPRSRPTMPPRSTPTATAMVQAPPSSKTGLIGVAIVLLGAAAIIAMTRSPPPPVPASPTPTSIRPPPVVRPAPVDSAPSAQTALVVAAPDAGVEPRLPEKTAVRSDAGNVQLPASAAGHRVFVDGRVQKDGSMLLVLPCGPHLIQIGSHGTQKSIDVLCGREIRLE